MRQEPVLQLKNVCKYWNQTEALQAVTLEVDENERFAVFGPIGCGKTTLAAAVCGAIPIDNGEILFGRRVKSALGIARQNPSFAPDLTLQENFELFACLSGLHRKKRSGRIAAVVEELGLSSDRQKLGRELSGQTIILAELGKALIPDSSLLIIDSVLDALSPYPEVFSRAWEAMKSRLRERGSSALITTSSDQVAMLCDRAALMHNGRILQVGTPEELRSFAEDQELVIEPILDPILARKFSERSGFAIEEREDGIYIGSKPENPTLARLLADQIGIGCVRLKKASLSDALKRLIGEEK